MKIIGINKMYIGISLIFFVFSSNIGAQTASNCYAILLNGGINIGNNYEGYYNNIVFVYKTLINEYNYNESNIYVLNSDGTDTSEDMLNGITTYPYWDSISSPLDLDGDNDNDINNTCNKEKISDVFDNLENTLTSNDFLLIYLTGANLAENNHWYYVWDNSVMPNHDYITDNELAAYIDQLEDVGKIVVITGYTRSGTIIDNIADANRVICTNVNSFEWGYWIGGNGTGYEEYTYHFFSAMAGETPGEDVVVADDNGDTYISIKEAHDYAIENLTASFNPQVSTDPFNLWANLTLSNVELCASISEIHDESYYNETISIEDCFFDIEDLDIWYGADVSFEAEHDIIVQSNMDITLNSDVILKAKDNIIIHSDLQVNLGSSLLIQN